MVSFKLAIIPLAIGLGAALPNGRDADSSPSNALLERSTEKVLCGLGEYAKPSIGPIRDGIKYLQDKRGQRFCVKAHSSGRPSCSYGTGFQVNVDGPNDICMDLGHLGDVVAQARDMCGIPRNCTDAPFGCGPSDIACCRFKRPAVQSFQEHYNVLIRGGFDC